MRQLFNRLIRGDKHLRVSGFDNNDPELPTTQYQIEGFNTAYNRSVAANNRGFPTMFTQMPIIFHEGPVTDDAPLNGVTETALLSVIGDHLQSKSLGPEGRLEHQMALGYINSAMQILGELDRPIHHPSYHNAGYHPHVAVSV